LLIEQGNTLPKFFTRKTSIASCSGRHSAQIFRQKPCYLGRHSAEISSSKTCLSRAIPCQNFHLGFFTLPVQGETLLDFSFARHSCFLRDLLVSCATNLAFDGAAVPVFMITSTVLVQSFSVVFLYWFYVFS
jgi:hypothetical protein